AYCTDESESDCDSHSDQAEDALDRLQAHAGEVSGWNMSAMVLANALGGIGGQTRHESINDADDYPLSVVPNIGAENRPRVADAHELGHAVGLKHAGGDCKDVGHSSLGIFPADDEGVNWPPDNTGALHGIGLEPRGNNSGSSA